MVKLLMAYMNKKTTTNRANCFFISTHELVYGAPQALFDHLTIEGVNKVFLAAHPLISDRKTSRLAASSTGKKSPEVTRSTIGLFPLNYVMHFLISLYWGWRYLDRRDCVVFVGANPLNALAGLIHKAVGIVDFTVYYTIDFTPTRYANPIVNRLYHRLDIFCATRCDETWNVSPRINDGRRDFSAVTSAFEHHHVVPIGVWDIANNQDRERHQLIFVGTMLEKQGVQLVLEALPKVLEKLPQLRFVIIGDGDYMPTIQQQTRDLGLKSRVEFKGMIRDQKQMFSLLTGASLAVATYDPEKASFTAYADPTKYKDYLSAGLPIIMTDVAHNCQDIENHGCGMIVDYNKDNIADAILAMMQSDQRINHFRRNAVSYITRFHWSKVFSAQLDRIDARMATTGVGQ